MPLFLVPDPLTGVTVPLGALLKGGEILDDCRALASHRPVPREPVLVAPLPLEDDE